MRFYKYRTKWSSGSYGWEYASIPDWSSPKEFFNGIAESNNWSEHFRGVVYHKVSLSKLPKEWVEEEIRHAKEDIASRKEYIQSLKEFYEEKSSK